MTIADAVARSGVAVIYPDKRGSGMSGGDWKAAGFRQLADDAVAAMRALRAQPRVDARRTGFVGLSQGGWIAPLAAQTLGDTAFNVSVSGTVVTPAEQLRHELEQDFRGATLTDVEVARLLEAVDLSLEYCRSGERWDDYLALLGSLRGDATLRPFAEPFPDEPSAWSWRFWRKIHDFDPLPHWTASPAPSLFIYGQEDEHDNIPVRETLARLDTLSRTAASGSVTVKVFPDMGHALFDDSGWVSGAFLDLLTGWIREHTSRPEPPARQAPSPR